MIWPWEVGSAYEYAVDLGRAHYGHHLWLPHEEHALLFSPPRTGKSALLAKIMLRYPGPVLSTTTRADIFRNTHGARRALGGRAHVFNPQGIGHVPSTMAWDPISGCLDITTAIRRADAFALAVSSGGVEDGAFWAAKTSDYLRAFFYAAAFAQSKGVRYGLPTTARWALGGSSQEAEEILTDAGALDWAAQLAELRGEAQKTAATVRMYMTRALGFLFDPSLAQSVSPRDDEPGLELVGFATHPDTLYMIASGQGEQSPLAPLFAALASEVHYTAGLVGSWSPTGRLPSPMLFALDEVTQICPVPLDTWMPDSGGKGIQMIPVVHGEAQLRKRWGKDGARIILDTAGTWVVLPGVSDPETLGALSKICGQVAIREHGADSHARHDVMTAEMIRQLPSKRALVKRGNLAPVICRTGRVWDDRLFKRARKDPEPEVTRRLPLAIVPGHVIDPPADESEAA